jgi:hypothetical protein
MNFYTDIIQKSSEFHNVSRVSTLTLLEPGTVAAVKAIISDAASEGISLIAFETYRSIERQIFLFKEGATKLETVGTHHFGIACDLVKANPNGSPDWSGDYSFLLPLARKHGLVSGQDWGEPNKVHTFVDADHCQRIPLWRQDALFKGLWYPPASGYDPYTDQPEGAQT